MKRLTLAQPKTCTSLRQLRLRSQKPAQSMRKHAWSLRFGTLRPSQTTTRFTSLSKVDTEWFVTANFASCKWFIPIIYSTLLISRITSGDLSSGIEGGGSLIRDRAARIRAKQHFVSDCCHEPLVGMELHLELPVAEKVKHPQMSFITSLPYSPGPWRRCMVIPLLSLRSTKRWPYLTRGKVGNWWEG